MNARQLRLTQSINRVSAVLRETGFHTPTIKPLRADLDRLVKELRDHSSVQQAAAGSLGSDGRGVARLKADLRRKHLLPLSRRAKLVLKGYPGIEESLRLPHARAEVKVHVAATKRLVKALRPHANALLAAGFRKSFLADCDHAARELAMVHANPVTARSRRSIATRSIADIIREAREIIESIDAHVNAELRDDRPLMAMWKAAKRVPARMGRPPRRGRGPSADS